MKKSILALCLVAAMSVAAAGDCYSNGVRVGSIQKFSQKGFVNKSWEGELVMEGTKIKGSSAGIRGGNVWAFSVLDPAVAAVIDEATMAGGEVALRYCQANPLDLTKGFSTNTAYRITQAVLRK